MIKLQDKHPMINNVFADWNVRPQKNFLPEDEMLVQHYWQQPFDDLKVFSVDDIRDADHNSWCKDFGDWFQYDDALFQKCKEKQEEDEDLDFDKCYSDPIGLIWDVKRSQDPRDFNATYRPLME